MNSQCQGSVSLVLLYKSLNMAAPLSNCTVVVECTVICFFVVVSRRENFWNFVRECQHNMVNTARYTNGWTDLNVGGQLLMMMSDHAGLQHHKQMTNVLKWLHWLKKTDYCIWYSIKCGHYVWIRILHCPRWPQLSQILCKMGNTSANKVTPTDPFTDTWGFVAETQPRRRGPVTMNCHGWWDMGPSLRIMR
jgi:hypothetical protein